MINTVRKIAGVWVVAFTLIAAMAPLHFLFAQSSDNEAETMLKQAYAFLNEKNFDEAENLFIKVRDSGYLNSQALNGLGQVYLTLGRSKVLILETFKKLLKQDNFSKAEKCFQSALKADSSSIDALYNLGRTYLAKENSEEAIGIFTKVLNKDYTYKDTPFQLGLGYMQLKDYSAAEKALKSGIMRKGDVAKTKIYLAEVFFKKNKRYRATKMYLEGMADLTDEEEMDRQLTYLEPILSNEKKKALKEMPIEKKGPYIVKYWEKKDPDPTTDENERLLEHFRRIDFSITNFSSKLFPGYDDRGKIFIKYGEPDQRFVSAESSWAYGGESWAYNSIHEYLSFDFVERGHNYLLVQDMGQVVRGSTPANGLLKNTYLRREYEKRAHLNSNYARMAQYERINDQGGIDMVNIQREYVQSVEEAITESPVEVFKPIKKAELPFDARIAEFIGKDNTTKVEIYYSLFFKNLEFIELPNYLGYKTNAHMYLVLQDENGVEKYRRVEKYPFLVNFKPETENQNVIKVESFEVPPGNYRLYFKLKNEENGREGMLNVGLQAKDYYSNELSISDIQFSLDAQHGDARFKQMKHGETLFPYPFKRILMSRPILTYFEIYNLTLNSGGRTDYEIEYIFWENEKKKQKIQSSSSSVKGTSRTDHSFTGLNLEKMKPGNYVLEIIVHDNVSGKDASISTSLELL